MSKHFHSLCDYSNQEYASIKLIQNILARNLCCGSVHTSKLAHLNLPIVFYLPLKKMLRIHQIVRESSGFFSLGLDLCSDWIINNIAFKNLFFLFFSFFFYSIPANTNENKTECL